MTVRLIRQVGTQVPNTLYTGPDEQTLLNIGAADSQIWLASNYSPSVSAKELAAVGLTQADLQGAVLPSALATLGVGYTHVKPLGVLAIGDSHTDGKLAAAAANDASAQTIQYLTDVSPLDQAWMSGGPTDGLPLATTISSNTGSTDPGIGNTSGLPSWLNFLPGMLRSAYQSFSTITFANVGVSGSTVASWAGEPAGGAFHGVALPTDGDTLTLVSTTYTFRTTPAAAYDVLIGASVTATQTNLANAINAEGTGWFAGTLQHPTCYAASVATLVQVRNVTVGTSGNGAAMTSSTAARFSVWNGTTDVTSFPMSKGSVTSALYANAKTAIVGFTPDIVTILLGTNDANRAGYRGRTTAACLATLVANVRADFPNAKIVMWKPGVITTSSPGPTTMTNVVAPAFSTFFAANPDIGVVDINILGIGSGVSLILNTSDGIHLTPYGYWLAAQKVARRIATALGLA